MKLMKFSAAALILAAASLATVKAYRANAAKATIPAHTLYQKMTLTKPDGQRVSHDIVRHVSADLNFAEFQYNSDGSPKLVSYSRDGRKFTKNPRQSHVTDYGALPLRLPYREDEVRGGVALRDLPSTTIAGVKCYRIGGNVDSGEVTVMWVSPALQQVLAMEVADLSGKVLSKLETLAVTYGEPDRAEVESKLPPRGVEVRQSPLSNQGQ